MHQLHNIIWKLTFPRGIRESFAQLPSYRPGDPFPRLLRAATLELASTHLICSVALTGVLALQAGRYWAESVDDDDLEEDSEELKGQRSRARTPVAEPRSTKSQ